jgi:hypothetical protein
MNAKRRFHGKGRRGQISLLIVFSIIPMITLFAFAVNIGMMVNAKINLQNAADLAAYAGAATQARQLTNISYINYMMRQAWKKFIYRYYVLGNISQKCFPRPNMPPECTGKSIGTAGDSGNWQNVSLRGESTGFPGVPATCIALSQESNPCQLVKAVPIVQPPPCNAVDPTCGALKDAANGIALIQQKSCAAGSTVNSEILGDWLYATEFQTQMASISKLSGLVTDDVGLVTEELLLSSRADSVKDLVNFGAQTVTTPSLNGLKSQDPAKTERAILAFKTASGNLNPAVFDLDTLEMQELLPSNHMLELGTINPGIKVVYSFLNGGDLSQGCKMQLESYGAAPPAAIFREGHTPVYYAVKVSAKARLLFNPFPFGSPDDSIEMTAYAAAMPFGSRIGPVVTTEDFIVHGKISPPDACPGSCDLPYPGLKMVNAGSNSGLSGTTNDFQHVNVLRALFQNLKDDDGTGSTAGSGAVGVQNITRGLRLAQLPDEYELGRYNIPTDAEAYTDGGGIFHQILPYFSTTANSSPATNDITFAFWAPIVPRDGQDAFTNKLQQEIGAIFSLAGSITGDTSQQNNKQALQTALAASIGKLLTQLHSRPDPFGNNFNVAKMTDPLSTGFFSKGNAPAPIPGTIPPTGPRSRLATSFATDHDGGYFQTGRDGYSVKFIPFKSLFGSPLPLTNDPSEANWEPIRDQFRGETAELGKVEH